MKGLEDVVLDEVSDLKMDFSKRDGEAASVTYQVLRKRLSQLSTKERRCCISYLHGKREERLPKLTTRYKGEVASVTYMVKGRRGCLS